MLRARNGRFVLLVRAGVRPSYGLVQPLRRGHPTDRVYCGFAGTNGIGEDHIGRSCITGGRSGRAQRIAGAGSSSPGESGPLTVRFLYAVWAVFLFDLHFFLGTVVFRPLGQLATHFLVLLLAVLVFRGPALVSRAAGWMWYAPYTLLLLSCFVTFPTAVNQLYAKDATQIFLIFYILAVATALIIRTARQALPIVAMFAGQFVWWAINGRAAGLIRWHPGLGNLDGFGGQMVMGTAICFGFAMATRSKWLKRGLLVLTAYCVFGVVTSFARGAFISLLGVAFFMWIRLPRKFATAMWGIAGALVVFAASAVLFPGGGFWTEMSSAFQEGASSGTGGLRWTLWKAATRVWMAHPLFGVGAGNFGAFASGFFRVGEINSFPEPMMLYGMNLHNSYFQILSELGLVGVIGFAWVMVDFLWRNRALRAPDAVGRWNTRTGGAFDLRYIALALEAANLANFMSGMFYASLFASWFYTVWIVNRMLWAVTRPNSEPDASPAAVSGVTTQPTRLPVRGGLRRPIVDPIPFRPPTP